MRRLTHSPGNDAHNPWSPDGKWIVSRARVAVAAVLIKQVDRSTLSRPRSRRSPSFQQHLLVYVRMFVHVRRRDGKLISLTGELRTFGGSTARRVEDQLTISSDGNFVLAYFDSLVDAVHALDSSLREARSGRRRKRFHGRRQPALDDGDDVNGREHAGSVTWWIEDVIGDEGDRKED